MTSSPRRSGFWNPARRPGRNIGRISPCRSGSTRPMQPGPTVSRYQKQSSAAGVIETPALFGAGAIRRWRARAEVDNDVGYHELHEAAARQLLAPAVAFGIAAETMVRAGDPVRAHAWVAD